LNGGQNNRKLLMHLKTTFKTCQFSQAHSQISTHSVCLYNAYCSQRSPSTRKRDIHGRQKAITPSLNIFHFQSSCRLQEILLRNGKDMLCCSHKCEEASTLLQSPQRVPMNYLLNDIFRNQHSSGRIGKWAMKLSEHVIDFEMRNTIKSQVMADFITDWTEPSSYTEGVVVEMT
jgi:hypothetical protein